MTMPWGRARRVASRSAAARPAVVVPLTEAAGRVLAEPVTARTALPAFDVATADGYAVSGPGPWTIEEEPSGRLPDGAATAVTAEGSLPTGTDAVLPADRAVVRAGKEVTWLYVGDGTGRQSDRPGHVPPGTAIRTGGEDCAAGGIVAPAGRLVTPALVAVAAATGNDALAVVRPPDVALVLVGDGRLDRGPARAGRSRDAVGPALPGALTGAGARCLPTHLIAGQVGRLREAVRAVVDDIAADLVVLTGEPGTAARDDAVRALAAIGSRPLVADIAVRPGGQALLAELSDGRLVVFVPGDIPGAVSGLVTVIAPLLRAMNGLPEPEPVLALLDSALAGDPVLTTLVPAQRTHGELADTAAVIPGGPVLALTGAGSMVVVPPGGATAGQLVELVDLP